MIFCHPYVLVFYLGGMPQQYYYCEDEYKANHDNLATLPPFGSGENFVSDPPKFRFEFLLALTQILGVISFEICFERRRGRRHVGRCPRSVCSALRQATTRLPMTYTHTCMCSRGFHTSYYVHMRGPPHFLALHYTHHFRFERRP